MKLQPRALPPAVAHLVLVRPMEVVLRKLHAERVICIGSIVWTVLAFAAAVVFPQRAVQIIGFMLGFFGMPLTMVTPLPMIFVPASWAPGYYLSLLLIAAGFLLQWQLVAWLLRRLFQREDRLHRSDAADHATQ